MLRFRPACVKHGTLALLAFALLIGAAEVGLRIHHSYRMQARGERLDLASLSAPSWKCHHFLKPLKSTIRLNPDTHLPVGIRTNSFGLRGKPVFLPKPRELFRIVYLGDETVFASELPEEETFCELIARDLRETQQRPCEVINAGIPGYCPLLSYLQFKHSLAGLKPDLLILNLDMSDVADDHQYRRHARIGADGKPLLCTHPNLQPDSNSSQQPFGKNSLLFQALKRQLGLLPSDDSRAGERDEIETPAGRYAWTREEQSDWQVYIAQTLAPIRDLRSLANQLSCPLVVTLSPMPWQISERAMPDPQSRRHWGIAEGKVYDPSIAMLRVSQYLKSQSIAYCELSGPFRAAKQPELLFLQTVPRFSRQGHLLFARVVSDYLKHADFLRTRSSAFPPVPSGGL